MFERILPLVRGGRLRAVPRGPSRPASPRRTPAPSSTSRSRISTGKQSIYTKYQGEVLLIINTTGGSIPANIIICGNNNANGHYLERCKETGHKPHPTRFPIHLPLFFIRFITDPGDLVIDPFAGSITTGEACAAEGRRWIAVDHNRDYLEVGKFRFEPDNQVVALPQKTRRKPAKGQAELF